MKNLKLALIALNKATALIAQEVKLVFQFKLDALLKLVPLTSDHATALLSQTAELV